MMDRKQVARHGLRASLEVRRRAGASKLAPICVYDLAENLGVEVRFWGGSRFGGMYARASQTILVPALRPPGRQATTCAHELGHWFFGHGTRVDELEDLERDRSNDLDERLANAFGSYLLMPPWAVDEAFARRKWAPHFCTSIQVYTVAGQLGVGYETLVQHLRWSLFLITDERAKELLKTSPKELRQSILGYDRSRHLLLVDNAWTGVPIDLQVENMALLPERIEVEGDGVRTIEGFSGGTLIEACLPGIGRASSIDGSWATFIRVCRKDFKGRSIYRHTEDPDVHQDTSTDLRG